MGQRLVIQIEEYGEPLANAYYHWSAYTECAADMTNDVLGYLNDANKDFTARQKAVWALYKTGARFAPDELAFMAAENIDKKEFEFAFDGVEADRNSGLLCVSYKGMVESEDWAECLVSVDVATGEIYFSVYSEESREDFEEYNKDIKVDELPTFDLLPFYGELRADEWDTFYANIKRLIRNNYAVKSSDGKTICSFIC